MSSVLPQFGFFPSRWRPVPRSLSLDPPASPTLRSRSPYTNAWRTMKLVAELLRLLPTNTVPLLTADPKPGSSSAPSSEPWSVPTLVCAPTMPTTSAGQPSTRSANGHYEARARALCTHHDQATVVASHAVHVVNYRNSWGAGAPWRR